MIETDTHIYFLKNYLSNFHRCTIKDKMAGRVFSTTEQAFMWWKADFFDDRLTRDVIETTTSPRAAKDLGRTVRNYVDSTWVFKRVFYMCYVNRLKFSQNEDIKIKLFATANKVLVEANPRDSVWGVGLAENDPLILDETNWRGQNLLGKVLMEVRETLRKETNAH